MIRASRPARHQRLRNWLLASSLLAAAFGAAAHDLWLEPTTRSAKVGQAIGVTVRIGQNYQGDAVPLAGGELGELYLADDGGRTPLSVVRGARPTAITRVRRGGPQWLVYRSLPIDITLPAATFRTYLALEGLDAVQHERERRGQADDEAHETYMRCAKTLLTSGVPTDEPVDHRLGLPLELIALPRTAGHPNGFQLLFEGRPLADALIVAMHRGSKGAADRTLSQRSDRAGQVAFELDAAGEWLVKAVHMLPAEGAAWRSWWASLSFALPAASPAVGGVGAVGSAGAIDVARAADAHVMIDVSSAE